MLIRLTLLVAYIICLTAKSQAQALPGFASVEELEPLPVHNNTADKPQSKVWYHDGKYWTVLTNGSGAHVWRLDGNKWVDVLKISESIYGKADCKVVGNVTHILLFSGEISHLISVEYVPESKTYKLWTEREVKSMVKLSMEAETATLDVDSKGRMWVAYDNNKSINVRWSDEPYTVWSEPIPVAADINTDDIGAIVALKGKIGVLWSNQNTDRFGFKTHKDGDNPLIWSDDEVPASKSAVNIGKGMADDHINMTVAQDGTLYCAVKTEYETAGYPKLGLLVRRPSGVWDKIYTVTEDEGTRPVVLLNEPMGKLRVVYTTSETGGDIVFKESAVSKIAFCDSDTLMKGSYNYVTSMKQTHSSDIVILASSTTHAVGVFATDNLALGKYVPACATEEADIMAYPNPFSDKVNINFVVPEGGEYTFILYDANGAKKMKPIKGLAEPGQRNTIEISGLELARGMYFVSLQTKNDVKTIKVVHEH